MKKLLLATLCILIGVLSFAQAPQMMSYQAVVRGSDNNLVINQQIAMRVSILQGSADGTAVYTEIHSAQTNANGLVTIEIGDGASSDDFTAINWVDGPYFVKTETDVNGGDNYDIVGVSQLLSVPYAMYAQTAGNIPDVSAFITAETDPQFNAWDKNYNDLTNRPEIPTVPTNVSAFTNDANYITSADVPAQVNADWNATGGAGQILNKPEIPTVPTNISAFDNDRGYITAASVPTNISAFDNDRGYITSASVPTNVSAFTNDRGYITITDVPAQVNADWNATAGAGQILNKPELFDGNYNNLTNTPDLSGYLTAESQTLADAAALGNSVNAQLKNVADPTENQDAVTKKYMEDIIAELRAEIAEMQATIDTLSASQGGSNGTYTVTFDANGGTGTMQPQTFTAGVAQNLTANIFTKENIPFIGWNTAADGSGTAYADGQSITVTENMTLYAQWEQYYCPSVTFASLGLENASEVSSVEFGSSPEVTLTFGQGTNAYNAPKYYDMGSAIRTYSGNTFTVSVGGLNVIVSISITFGSGDGSNAIIADNGSYTDGVWTGTESAVTFTVDGTSGNRRIAGIEVCVMPEVSYTVTFDANGGAGTMQPQIFTQGTEQAIDTNTFTKNNCTFTGWNTAADGSGTAYADGQSITATEDMTLYAQWTMVYTVTFNANGGAGTMQPQTFMAGTAQTITTSTFTKENNTFAGWNTAANGSGTEYADGQSITVSADMTLYAQWTPITYTVAFDSNGGIGAMNPQIFTAGTAQILATNLFIKDNCTFVGWNTAADGSGTEYRNGLSIIVSGNMTLYAQWAPITYTIVFFSNGGTGTMNPQTFTAGAAQSLATNTFTNNNYIFTGWNTAANGSGTAYTNGQRITLSSNMTLYAQWGTTTGTLNGHEWVDLGLPSGTRWATCNVGANSPTAYGNYYAWGETTTKTDYDWSTYRYCNGSNNTLTKYCSNADYGNNGFTDALTSLVPTDDAATANWGWGWRMPTYNEMRELINYCTVTWTTQNGVNGYLFTGPNGNSIFLPAAGYRYGSELYDAGSYGDYWSSSLDTVTPYRAWYLYFRAGNYYMGYDYRSYGQSVRPVCVSQN